MDDKDKKIEALEREIGRLKAAFTILERKVLKIHQLQARHGHEIKSARNGLETITRGRR